MAGGTLGARQAAVLAAVVREYIRSGEPVGSKHLVGRYRLDVSPATVRSDMALLEDLGFLTQPHTSAGRVPTDRGYRWFVDMVAPPPIPEGEERELLQALGEPLDLEAKLDRASEILSRLTRYASAVLTPRLERTRVRHLDLALLAPRLVVAIVIGDGGRVAKRVVEVDADVTEEDVERVAESAAREVAGVTLEEAERRLAALARHGPARDRAVLAAASDAIAGMRESDRRVLVGGAANLADTALGADPETLRRVYEALERHTEVLRLLEEAMRPVSVRIGSELPVEDLRALSVVAAPYGMGREGAGTVGVIGPTRMDYLRAMAIVAAVARTLEASLRALSG
jgi:heat-inducible transcriptional repressor